MKHHLNLVSAQSLYEVLYSVLCGARVKLPRAASASTITNATVCFNYLFEREGRSPLVARDKRIPLSFRAGTVVTVRLRRTSTLSRTGQKMFKLIFSSVCKLFTGKESLCFLLVTYTLIIKSSFYFESPLQVFERSPGPQTTTVFAPF